MNAKRRNSLLTLLVSVLLLSLMATACSPAATPAATQKPQPTTPPPLAPTSAPTKAATTGPTALPTLTPLSLGTVQVLGGLSIAPVKVEQMAASGSDRPQAGNVFEVVTLNVENSGLSTVTFNPILFIIVDPTTNASFPVKPLASLANGLKLRSLKPGETVTGVIAYEVPQKSAGHLNLMFKGDNNQNALWKIAG